MEPAYVQVGATGTASPVIPVTFQLGKLVDTIFALNKDLCFAGDSLYLDIYWQGWTKMLFTARSTTNPTTNHANAAVSGGTISNVMLMLACEADKNIADDVRAMSKSGFTIPIDWIVWTKFNGTGSNHAFTAKFSSAQGRRLKKVHVAPYAVGEAGRLCYDHSNIGCGKITTFETYLNDDLIPKAPYQVARFDDYTEAYEKLKGSSIFSKNEFYYNWKHTIDFTLGRPVGERPRDSVTPDQNLIDGWDMTTADRTEIRYNFLINGDQNLSHYVYGVTQRFLTINKDAIIVS